VRLRVSWDSETVEVEVVETTGGRFQVRFVGEGLEVEARLAPDGIYAVVVDGVSHCVDVAEDGEDVVAAVGGETYRFQVETPGGRGSRASPRGGRAGTQRVLAPMPGKVVAVHVRVGDRVEPGSPLVVLEAMKMENEFRATATGVVAAVRVAPGQAVNGGDLLVEIAPGPVTP
jgi:biotin carboxyl carrier protein